VWSDGDGVMSHRDEVGGVVVGEQKDSTESGERGLPLAMPSASCAKQLTFSTWIGGKSPWNIVLISRS